MKPEELLIRPESVRMAVMRCIGILLSHAAKEPFDIRRSCYW